MTVSPDLRHAVQIVASVVRNIRLKRELQRISPNPDLNFWRLINGNCFDVAIIDWCKLFGSDDDRRQAIHWKNLVPATQQAAFRTAFLAAASKTIDEWKEYWEAVKLYRDQHAAHYDPKYLSGGSAPTYPDLSAALETTYCYYDWLLATLNASGAAHSFPHDIRAYSDRFANQAAAAAKSAISATAGMRESVF